MNNTPNLGELITDEDAERDAVHIAVAPVIAGDYLNPGQWVALDWNDRAVATTVDPIGVVDPWLKGSVKRGQRFWLLLVPNTITSLRHEWIHPRFHPKPTKQVKTSVSEAWLREFCDDYSIPYEEMMVDVTNALNRGDDCLGCLGSSLEVDYEVFWSHYQIVTGQALTKEDTEDKWFRCAC